jgi:hypothetical protein
MGKSFLAKSLTLCPFKASSTTSTTLSIYVTPSTLTSSSPFKFLSPYGTHPETITGLPKFCAF